MSRGVKSGFRRDYPGSGASGFIAVTPTVTNVGVTAFAFRWTVVGSEIRYTGSFNLLGAPTGAVSVSLPISASSVHGFGNAAPRGVVQGVRTAVASFTGNAFIASATTLQFISNGAGAVWGTGVPAAWAAGDTWGFSVMYERA